MRAAPEVTARLSRGGYVFPVFGPAAFGDTLRRVPRPTSRASWHHGEDIVAPLGTPLLAVADGTLFSVGWNDVGGYRLWLRDDDGNEFYYAHLSRVLAARDRRAAREGGRRARLRRRLRRRGRRHRRTSTSRSTPSSSWRYGYDGVVAPYPFLVAWRRAEDVSFASGRTYVLGRDGLAGRRRPVASAQAGAVLLDAEDISAASGLVPGALKRALAGGEARSGAGP